jgi:hypothetical protein
LVEVTSGLVDGEQVVTVGQASLKQDTRVTVINNDVGATELQAETGGNGSGREGSEDAATD